MAREVLFRPLLTLCNKYKSKSHGGQNQRAGREGRLGGRSRLSAGVHRRRQQGHGALSAQGGHAFLQVMGGVVGRPTVIKEHTRLFWSFSIVPEWHSIMARNFQPSLRLCTFPTSPPLYARVEAPVSPNCCAHVVSYEKMPRGGTCSMYAPTLACRIG